LHPNFDHPRNPSGATPSRNPPLDVAADHLPLLSNPRQHGVALSHRFEPARLRPGAVLRFPHRGLGHCAAHDGNCHAAEPGRCGSSPLVMRLLAWVTGRWSGVSWSLTLRHMARGSGQYAPLLLLLIVTTGLGIY